MSTNFKDTIFNCFNFLEDVEQVVRTRYDTFEDITDLYSSFLFNMLGKSLSIKTVAENIADYNDAGEFASMAEEIAKLVRLLLDFESATSESNPMLLK